MTSFWYTVLQLSRTFAGGICGGSGVVVVVAAVVFDRKTSTLIVATIAIATGIRIISATTNTTTAAATTSGEIELPGLWPIGFEDLRFVLVEVDAGGRKFVEKGGADFGLLIGCVERVG